MTKQLKVDNIVNVAGTGKPNFPVSPTSGGAALSTLNHYSYISSATEPSSPKNGAIWWDSANSKVYVYANGEFKEVTLNTDYPSAYSSYSGPAYMGTRGIIAGGYGGSTNSTGAEDIQYITIASPGNATDFGNLTRETSRAGMHSNGSRIVVAGGRAGGTATNSIDYITAATTGNASDFGDLTESRFGMGGGGDATRSVFAGGWGAVNTGSPTGTDSRTIDYITTGTTGNATNFGDLSYYRKYITATSDATRTIFAGGQETASGTNSLVNTMEYVTTQTTGNVTDFGDLLAVNYGMGAGVIASATRGIFVGGSQFTLNPYTFTYLQTIQYVTIATTGNATDFGDTLQGLVHAATCADGTTGIIAGGQKGGSGSQDDNTIQKITIATTGNATDFGDLNAINSSDANNKYASAASGT